MATYTTDFSEYSTGSAPSDWTDRWATSWSTNVESSTGRMDTSFGAQVMELDPTADARKLLSWDDIDSDADRDDVDLLLRFQLSSYGVSDYAIRLQCRGSGALAAENSYSLYIQSTWFLRLHKYVAGASITLDSYNIGSALGGKTDDMAVWMRLRANGSDIKGKMWSIEEDEPDWMVEATDSAVTGVGWAGIGNYSDMSTRKAYADYFAVGTNGDAPALPVATTGNAQLNGEHIEVAYSGDTTRVDLAGMHVEVAHGSPDAQAELAGMHVEVAYSINPTELDESPVICINT